MVEKRLEPQKTGYTKKLKIINSYFGKMFLQIYYKDIWELSDLTSSYKIR